ncbi:glutamate synthase [miscellaneous Crenarchaeota group-15 archaeon DG-45]|uniref:Archaeal glutamate synthase [NADPH] n=1 Tax=miscellaneous Crenarchaeota group-15 archaeon DG-45 TaxID=1685127 RepID=A0A0M0BRQ1_9ARCH|nr:MAG: glutamate synthase [miscellaneous Crenarchaeota group-15 archaeon DG-45]
MRVRSLKRAYEVHYNYDRCIGCLRCVKICPVDALEARLKGPYSTPYPYHEERCTGCRECQDICPTNAIQIRPTEPEEFIRGIWTFDTIDDIRERASTGKALVSGTGTHRRFPTLDDLLIVPAQLSFTPRDVYREECITETVIGAKNPDVERPLALDVPIMIGAMSYGAISREAKIALAKATQIVHIPTNTGEGGLIPEEREEAYRLVVQYSTGRFGVSAEYLRASDMVEIKIGQGAKPGMGGHLLGEKVTADIAAIRGLPIGTDALSPAYHLDMTRPGDLAKHVEMIRDVVDYQVPIGIKLGPGRVKEDVILAAEAGADAIWVDGMEGGTGAAPIVVTEHAGIPTIACVSQAAAGLEEAGLRGRVSLIVGGGIRNGADIAKALALGADLVGISTPFLVTMGCSNCGQCAKGICRQGISTQDPALRARLNIEKSAIAAANYVNSITHELKNLTMLTGKNSVHDLDRDDLRALTMEAAMMTGVKMMGLEKTLP